MLDQHLKRFQRLFVDTCTRRNKAGKQLCTDFCDPLDVLVWLRCLASPGQWEPQVIRVSHVLTGSRIRRLRIPNWLIRRLSVSRIPSLIWPCKFEAGLRRLWRLLLPGSVNPEIENTVLIWIPNIRIIKILVNRLLVQRAFGYQPFG